MVTLEEHIKILRECDAIDPVTSTTCRYFMLVMNEHYVDVDNTHAGIAGKEGFLDSTGKRMTVDEFFNAITAPEPPEPQRRPRKNAVPTVQRTHEKGMGSHPYIPLR